MITEYTTHSAITDFKNHGEYQLLENITGHLNVIFDVGCNIGEWSRMARSLHPSALIHMFEIAPITFQKLLRNNVIDEGMIPNSFGLSSKTQEIPIRYVPENDRVTTAVLKMHHENSHIKTGVVVNPMTYMKNYNCETIDFLKLDTEGHEFDVLQGFTPILEQGNIKIIMFEYGYANIPNKHLLMDYYQLLEPFGYVIGKLYPDGVDFQEYKLYHEDFKGPNYVAVHKSQQEIIHKIKKGTI